MKEFIYGSNNWVHIIDLTKTVTQLADVNAKLAELHANGKKVLFVATKLQSRDAFSKLASDSGNFFVSEKWVPGLLTNFKTIKVRISTYLKLIRDSEGSGFDMLTKKERAAKMLELEKLDKAFKGLKLMKRPPDALFVVDSVYEKQAVKEAKTLGIPCFAVCNTNGNPYWVDAAIPANTNSVKSLDYLAVALKDGFKAAPKKPAPKAITPKTAPAKAAEAKAPAKKAEPTKKPAAKKVETKTEEK